MNTNSRFAVAIHILTLLAFKQDETLTSSYLACSVTTNPVVIRRILGDLRRAGLVVSQSGNGGGWRLTRLPEQITLFDAYTAVKEGCLFAMHHQKPNPACRIGGSIQQALTGFFTGAEAALEAQLGGTTLSDVLARVQTISGPVVDSVLVENEPTA